MSQDTQEITKEPRDCRRRSGEGKGVKEDSMATCFLRELSCALEEKVNIKIMARGEKEGGMWCFEQDVPRNPGI